MKDRELAPDEGRYAVRGAHAYATCCHQNGMVGANGVDDRIELVAAHLAGFTSAISYRDVQDRMDRYEADRMLEKIGAKDQLAQMTKERLIEIALKMAPIAVAATSRPEWDVREGRFVENRASIMELFR